MINGEDGARFMIANKVLECPGALILIRYKIKHAALVRAEIFSYIFED